MITKIKFRIGILVKILLFQSSLATSECRNTSTVDICYNCNVTSGEIICCCGFSGPECKREYNGKESSDLQLILGVVIGLISCSLLFISVYCLLQFYLKRRNRDTRHLSSEEQHNTMAQTSSIIMQRLDPPPPTDNLGPIQPSLTDENNNSTLSRIRGDQQRPNLSNVRR